MDNLPTAHPLKTITIPSTTEQTHTIIFLHGRADTASKFSSSLHFSRTSDNKTLAWALPSLKWVFPQTEYRHCSNSMASPTGTALIPQWFDIWNTQDFSDHEELQAVGLKESVASIRQILADEAAALDGRWDRIILAGISQGAAVSVHTLLNLDLDCIPNAQGEKGSRGLAAFLGFHCRMPFPGRSLEDTRKVLELDSVPEGNEVLRNTPVLLEHNIDDPLVLHQYGKVLKDTLVGFGADVVSKEYARGGHWFNAPQGIDDAVEFVKAKALSRVETVDYGIIEWGRKSSAMDMS